MRARYEQLKNEYDSYQQYQFVIINIMPAAGLPPASGRSEGHGVSSGGCD